MKVAIVGSRSWPKRKRHMITDYVLSLPEDTVVVSGGADGPDTWAEEVVYRRGLPRPIIIPPHPSLIRDRGFGYAAFARNTVVAATADLIPGVVTVTGFIDPESKTQGAMDTVRKARGMGKKTKVFYPDGTEE